eukprot:scaffold27691_cov81-Isochrysis_galbana.AAC.2
MVRWPAGAASQKASALTPPHRPPAWAENGAPAGDRPVPAAYRPTETKPSAAPHARAAAPPAARGTRSMAVRFPPSPAPGRAGGGASSPCRSSSCCQTDAPPPRTAATAIEDADSRARDTRSACPGIATSPVVLKTWAGSDGRGRGRRGLSVELPRNSCVACRLRVLAGSAGSGSRGVLVPKYRR